MASNPWAWVWPWASAATLLALVTGCPTSVVAPTPGISQAPAARQRAGLDPGYAGHLQPGSPPPPEDASKSGTGSSVTALSTLYGLIGTTYQVLVPRPLRGHRDAINSAVFSPDGTSVLTASADVTTRLFDANTGSERLLRAGMRAVSIAPSSPRRQADGHGSADHTARLWAAEGGRSLQVLSGHTGSVNAVAFFPGWHQAPDRQRRSHGPPVVYEWSWRTAGHDGHTQGTHRWHQQRGVCARWAPHRHRQR